MTDGPGSTPDPRDRPESWAPPSPYSPGPYSPGPYSAGPHQPGPPGPVPPAYGYGYPPPPPRPGIIALRPLGLGDILDGTVKLIRSHPRATLGLSAVVGVIVALPLAVGDAVYFREMGSIFARPTTPTDDSLPFTGLVAQSAGTAVSLLLTFVAATLLTGLLTRVLGRAVFGARITAGEAWRMTRSRVWALLGLSLVVLLVLLLPVVVVAGSLIGVGIALDLTALIVVGVISALLWLVYAAFVGTRLALAPAALVLESLGVGQSMRRSWRLVKGDSWRVFGIILLTQLLIGIVGGIVTVPFAIGSMALAFLGAGSVAATAAVAVLIAIGETLSAMLVYPFTAGVYGLLYADRRMRAEAFDLVLQSAATEPGETSVDDLWQPTPADSAAVHTQR